MQWHRNLPITFFGILACITLPAQAATSLIFDVTAQRSVQGPGNGEEWLNTGGPSQFQFTVVLDDGQYSYSDEISAGIPFDYERDGVAPIASTAGQSVDDISSFKQNLNVVANTPDSSFSRISTSGTNSGFHTQNIRIQQSTAASTEIGHPYQATYPLGTFTVAQHSLFNESLSLTEARGPDVDGIAPSLEDYLQNWDTFNGSLDAFDFRHSASTYIDECLAGNSNLCASNLFGQPRQGQAGVRYIGSATLVGISEVPLPAAAWLFISALCGLGLLKRQRG